MMKKNHIFFLLLLSFFLFLGWAGKANAALTTCYTCSATNECVANSIDDAQCFHVPGGDDCIDGEGNKYECHHKYAGSNISCGGTLCGPGCEETTADCDCTSCVGEGGGDDHTECDANCSCVTVAGSGTSECSIDSDCYPCGDCIPCGCGTRVPPKNPSVVTNEATNVLTSSATLNGELRAMGGVSSVDVWFQWGTDTSYGNSTPQSTLSETGKFSRSISGLSNGQTYHFRAVARNSQGTVYGADRSFSTPIASTENGRKVTWLDIFAGEAGKTMASALGQRGVRGEGLSLSGFEGSLSSFKVFLTELIGRLKLTLIN